MTLRRDEEVRVRGLAAAVEVLERALDQAVEDARSAGVDSVSLSVALGVSRSTLYRRWPVPAGDDDS